MSINHSFTSAKADGTDATQIQPSNWNAAHTINTPTNLNGGTGVVLGTDVAGLMSLDGVKSSAALQYLRRNALNTAYEFTANNELRSSDFDFTAQTPGGSLIIGSNTITLTPVPPGINGSNTSHYVYISNGTGTAEAVLITGGTAVSGAATGTIIVTCANTHSSTWTIGSATAGLSEAAWFSGGAAKRIRAVSGTLNLYAPFTVPPSYFIGLRGCGIGVTLFSVHGTTGNWLVWDSTTNGSIDLGDFTIGDSTNTRHTSGSMISLATKGAGIINNIQILNGFIGITLNYVVQVFFQNLHINAIQAGIDGSGSQIQIFINNCFFWISEYGVKLSATQVTGFYISNSLFSGVQDGTTSACGILFNETAGAAHEMNEIVITGNEFDVGTGSAIAFVGNSGTVINNSVCISNNRLLGAIYGIVLQDLFRGVVITGNYIAVTTATCVAGIGILNSSIRDVIIANNQFQIDDNTSFGIQFTGSAHKQIKIIGNIIGMDSATPTYGVKPSIGIALVGVTNVQLENNVINAVGSIVTVSSVVSLTMSHNVGIDNVVPNVADAATLVLPLNPSFKITGSGTAVTQFTITGGFRAGMVWRFVPVDGNIAFTAGNLVANTKTVNQNTLGSLYYDGTVIWVG